MTARVLVVDDILANVKLLEARLQAEYFEVLTANSGQQALDVLARESVDVVLLDVMMPGMDGFEACRRIKANHQTHHIPVVMVTALDQPSDKVLGLESGADDFLTKPVDDIALVTRVKNLARLKMLNDEMMMRASTGREMGIPDDGSYARAVSPRAGRVLLVDDHPRSAARLLEVLKKSNAAVAEFAAQQALERLAEEEFDIVVVSLSLQDSDGLRLCSQIRSVERTRHLPVIMLVEPGDEARLLRGLDMGVNDYLMRPIDRHELLARVKTQIKRKRHSDFLRRRLAESVEMSVTDPLTGLHNRRYMEGHLKTLVGEALRTGRALSILVADIDYFKLVNDNHGHVAGDAVLKEFADRLKRNTRGVDLACRLGGEEFVLIMPDTDLKHAYQVGERLRACVAADDFEIGSEQIRITASVGIGVLENSEDTPETLFQRADNALYLAKRRGRNQVVADAA
ncbi:PleD family two-component system response regulator [Hyphomicrobium methylovorum]|uniref:PleD family two-component system response regulator n=1 Tax=Hyphomicrobium methylovorum TaxID=84 RepID=UPI0015E67219|nr:PleD family two-component system response regulator [Hyphomicrobium methylovorum]MBA2127147.1 PleD family two-component system response regulator [Hyphomicrobium methylovorum]